MTKDEALAGLKELIGRETPPGDWFEMTQERIDAFAETTLDPQWIHTDVERAQRESPYGTTIAHGFLTLSLLNPMTNGHSPVTRFRQAAQYTVNYGLNRVRFPAPVLAAGRIRGRSTLVEVKEINARCLQYARQVTLEVEGSDKPCCVAEQVHRLYYER